jgi:hypothetical protein
MQKKYIIFLIVVGIFIMSLPIIAQEQEWKNMGDNNFILVYDNLPVIFGGLQDIEKKIIGDKLQELYEGDPIKAETWVNQWKGTRPDIVSPLKFYSLDLNKANQLNHDIIELEFLNSQELSKVKFSKININGKEVLFPANPEDNPLPFGIISSNDKTKYIIPLIRELWVIDSSDFTKPKKISSNTYNGKTWEELTLELQSILPEDTEANAVIWWNANPTISPDGAKISFVTNRDFNKGNEGSVWIYDMISKEEKKLTNNVSGEWYRIDGWIDNNSFIAKKYADSNSYVLIDIEGTIKQLPLKGINPEVLAVNNNLIAYEPDASKDQELFVAEIDKKSGKIIEILHKEIEGYLISNSVSFNSTGSKLAFVYGVGNDGHRRLSMLDINKKEEKEPKQSVLGGRILGGYVKWLDEDRVLVHTSKLNKEGLHNITSWIYSFPKEGVK